MSSLVEWTNKFIEAKKQEENAREKRIEAENKVIDLSGVGAKCGLDKSKTETIGGYKYTVKKPLRYSLDMNKWDAIKSKISPSDRPIRVKYEVDKPGYNWLRVNNKEVFNLVSEAITVKEGKPSMSVQEKE